MVVVGDQQGIHCGRKIFLRQRRSAQKRSASSPVMSDINFDILTFFGLLDFILTPMK
jgi:hypothetical protein